MFCNIGYAEMRLIERDAMKDHKYVPALMTVCIDNYKFAISKFHEAVSMVQFHEERDGKSLPAKC